MVNELLDIHKLISLAPSQPEQRAPVGIASLMMKKMKFTKNQAETLGKRFSNPSPRLFTSGVGRCRADQPCHR